MDFRILGPLDVLDGGEPVALGGSRQRALLALLLLHAGEAVSSDRLIEALWGAPRREDAAGHVSRLRKALGADGAELLRTREHGYELRIAPEQLDANRFAALLARARDELAAGRAAEAARVLDDALALWRGRPLDDLAYEPFAQPRDRPAGGAAGRGARAAGGGAARARPPRRGRRRAAGADRGAPVPRAAPGPAHARPLPRRPPGRRAARLPGRAPHAGRRAGHRAGRAAARARARDPRPGSRAGRAGRPARGGAPRRRRPAPPGASSASSSPGCRRRPGATPRRCTPTSTGSAR